MIYSSYLYDENPDKNNRRSIKTKIWILMSQ